MFGRWTIIFIFALVGPAWGKDCVIEAWPNYLKEERGKLPMVRELFKSSSCPQKFALEVAALLASAEGVVTGRHLRRILGRENVQIRPDKIEVNSLLDAVAKGHALGSNWHFANPGFSDRRSLVPYSGRVKVDCPSCGKVGRRVFKIETDKPGKVLWGEVDVVIRSRALLSRRSLPANEKLQEGDFKMSEVYSKYPERLFTNANHLSFYKTNKTVLEGTPLKRDDLTALSLVRVNRPVKIFLEKRGLSLSSLAVPLSSGKMGEMVRLRNEKSKKIIVGKVVDFNRVSVDL